MKISMFTAKRLMFCGNIKWCYEPNGKGWPEPHLGILKVLCSAHWSKCQISQCIQIPWLSGQKDHCSLLSLELNGKRTIGSVDNRQCGQSSVRTIVRGTYVRKDICPRINIWKHIVLGIVGKVLTYRLWILYLFLWFMNWKLEKEKYEISSW